jgi:hypothetical protein
LQYLQKNGVPVLKIAQAQKIPLIFVKQWEKGEKLSFAIIQTFSLFFKPSVQSVSIGTGIGNLRESRFKKKRKRFL